MLTPGNTKLGKVHNWSISAAVTCPGKSKYCESICYALQGRYLAKNVQKAHARNFELCKQPGWTQDMINEISKKKVTVVRIHAAGDFFNAGYTRNWTKIVAAHPDVQFYAYTRSWTKPLILPALRDLAKQSNMELWWSWDHSMPEPPEVEGVRVCYLMKDDNDTPPKPVDLVFRELPNGKKYAPMKRANNSPVCPYEQGIVGSSGNKPKVNCETCKICFTRKCKAKSTV